MKIFTVPPAERTREWLARFLDERRREAAFTGDERYVSIAIRVEHIDPLAVLESIYNPGELHFYLERSEREQAIAGAGGTAVFTSRGDNRFSESREFMERALKRTICVGDMDTAFAKPHFFCSFTFFDEPGEKSGFPGAMVFLPRWQVARDGDDFSAVANLRINADSDVESAAAKVWRAHERFRSFHRHPSSVGGELQLEGGSMVADDGARHGFIKAVEEALSAIRRGEFEKVVIARFQDLELPKSVRPLQALNRLRIGYPTCFTYSVANGRGESFIGASPELLVRRRGDLVETEALAGSAPRGRTASEDAALAEALLRSDKDNREHRVVVDSIQRRLAAAGVAANPPRRPRLAQLPNVQHLRTPIRGSAPAEIHLLDVLKELHPTPAVGGAPRAPACAAIRRLEDFDRGLYAGAIGWIDAAGDGELTVAIRSTLIRERGARLYAGAGIVEGSDPDREWQETEIKLRAVLEAMGAS